MIPLSLRQVSDAIGASWESRSREVLVRRVSTDSREVKPGDLFVALRGPRFDGNQFVSEASQRGAAACVCDRRGAESLTAPRSIPPIPALVVDDTGKALMALASFYRRQVMSRSTVVIGVTGSNGKTTTKSLIDHVLGGSLKGRAAPRSFNNAIGVPLTLLSVEADDAYVVVEMGTSAPGELASLAATALPNVGVITSISEAHLEGLGDIHGVAAEKTSLLRYLRPDDLAVVNLDRSEIKSYVRGSVRAALVTFGRTPFADVRVTDVAADWTRTSFVLEGRYRVELPLPGAHHAANAAAAYVVARRFGIAPEEIARRLGSFVAVEGRCKVLDIAGVRVVDDSYNANPASMTAAIEALGEMRGRRIFVMGDMRELGPASSELHRRVFAAAVSAGFDLLIAVGAETSRAVADAASSMEACRSSEQRTIACDTVEAAGAALLDFLRAGDTVWIKGSRAMGLDRVVEGLRGRLGRTAAVA
jgi:UDP-N-acetylmuramoyl-tripeptide--D-alanyl-D-alanine ligase